MKKMPDQFFSRSRYDRNKVLRIHQRFKIKEKIKTKKKKITSTDQLKVPGLPMVGENRESKNNGKKISLCKYI